MLSMLLRSARGSLRDVKRDSLVGEVLVVRQNAAEFVTHASVRGH